MMTSAQARVEAGLDQQAMYESYYDYDYDYGYDDERVPDGKTRASDIQKKIHIFEKKMVRSEGIWLSDIKILPNYDDGKVEIEYDGPEHPLGINGNLRGKLVEFMNDTGNPGYQVKDLDSNTLVIYK